MLLEEGVHLWQDFLSHLPVPCSGAIKCMLDVSVITSFHSALNTVSVVTHSFIVSLPLSKLYFLLDLKFKIWYKKGAKKVKNTHQYAFFFSFLTLESCLCILTQCDQCVMF